MPWEVSLPSINTKVGTNSNATPATPHSQLNTHFELTTLDPLSTNHKNNHNSPLTLDYKYDRQRKKKGLDSGSRNWEEDELERAEVIKRVRARSKFVGSWCREQPKVENP